MNKLIFVLIIFSFASNLYPQAIMFNENKLEYFFDSTFTGYDSILIYNSGSNLLVVDSIYSKNYYGYFLEIFYSDSSFNYYVFTGYDPFNLSIEPSDTVKLMFSYPDFCPVCKNSLNITAFADTLIIHSNSLANNYSYISVEGDGSTDVNDDNILLDDFVLYQNYPNPFNPTTKIECYIPKTSFISIKIYDLMGREIKTLIEAEQFSGKHSVVWDGTNKQNLKVSSSIYFYKMVSSKNNIIRKMVYLK